MANVPRSRNQLKIFFTYKDKRIISLTATSIPLIIYCLTDYPDGINLQTLILYLAGC